VLHAPYDRIVVANGLKAPSSTIPTDASTMPTAFVANTDPGLQEPIERQAG
jgi:hypothetical protein